MDTSGKISEYDVDRMNQLLTGLKVFQCYCHVTRYILNASYDLGKWNLVEPGWNRVGSTRLTHTWLEQPSPQVRWWSSQLFLWLSWLEILSVSLSFIPNYCEIIFSIKIVKTWSWVELSGSRESSQRHWCPSLSCMRTRYKCLVDDPIKIQLIFKSFFYLYVSIETHSTSPKVAHLQPAYNTYHIS